MDYVLRDSYMCGVAVGPIDIERIMYYSFFSEKGLTLDRGGIQAFIMFLNARFYMYTNVYYHRTTRGIDLHLKEIFRDTMRLVFPYDLNKELQPYLHMTEWTLLEDVGRWDDADDAGAPGPRRASGARCSTASSSGACPTRWCSTSSSRARGQSFMKAEEVEQRVRELLPPGLRDLPVQDRHGPAGPAPAQPDRHAGPPDLRLRRGLAHACRRSRSRSC